MDLNPRDLSKFRGAIIGGNWEKAPDLSDDWRRMVVGKLPYSEMPKVG